MTAVRRRKTWAVAGSMLALAATALAVPGTAAAATSGSGLYITGAGFGHGVGMSQYGAAGYAEHGFNYREILERYYSQTTISSVDPDRVVTVLLKPGGQPVFSGATNISGAHTKLKPGTQYTVRAVGPKLKVVTGTKTIGTYTAPLKIIGAKPMTLVGTGTYRGAFIFRPTGAGGVQSVNAVGLDDYVRGVVGAEMPTAWPAQALEAQAVAARTYAITDGQIQSDFDVYDDTRSQMYEGVKVETPATDSAVAATRGQVVDYDGRPVVTYFFASSGGQTESVQNVFGGIGPESWLVGKADPYDDSFNNPYYHWKLNLTLASAGRRLGRLVEGSFDGVKILSTGVSPRIVVARIVGSRGSSTVTGVQLEKDFGTPSTWMSLTTISATGVQTTRTVRVPPPAKAKKTKPTKATIKPTKTTTEPTKTVTKPTKTVTKPTKTVTEPTTKTLTTKLITTTAMTTTTASTTTPDTTAGGTVWATTPTTSAPVPGAAAARAGAIRRRSALAQPARLKLTYSVRGTIFPSASGARVFAQRYVGGGDWSPAGSAAELASGAYSIPVPKPGLYRVLYGAVIGPQITVR